MNPNQINKKLRKNEIYSSILIKIIYNIFPAFQYSHFQLTHPHPRMIQNQGD
jgi:hypothetical protein